MATPHLHQAPTRPRPKREPAAYRDLVSNFAGTLLHPGDHQYDDRRRIWNGSIDRRPALIARCAGPADVRAAVRYAARTGTAVAVRGGGHSFPGHSAITAASSSTSAR